MPRKSRADILSDRYGGKWVFNYIDTWTCDDGRTVRRELKCQDCWKWNRTGKCVCRPKYIMTQLNGEIEIVNTDDSRIYRKNGIKVARF